MTPAKRRRRDRELYAEPRHGHVGRRLVVSVQSDTLDGERDALLTAHSLARGWHRSGAVTIEMRANLPRTRRPNRRRRARGRA